MPNSSSRLVPFAAVAAFACASVSAEPLNFVHAPASKAAPASVEAAMFDFNVNLAQASELNDLLLQSGIEQGDAASAAALAEGQVDDKAAVRVKLGLSRNPDTGAVSLQRMVLSTAAVQTTIEQRSGKLRIVSSAPRKLRIV